MHAESGFRQLQYRSRAALHAWCCAKHDWPQAGVSHQPLTPRQTAVQVIGGADEREMRERLREVAELLPARPQLLGVQTEVIGVAEHLFEVEPRLLDVARTRKTLHVPERAHRERALLAREAVGRGGRRPVAVDERIVDELGLDRPQ